MWPVMLCGFLGSAWQHAWHARQPAWLQHTWALTEPQHCWVKLLEADVSEWLLSTAPSINDVCGTQPQLLCRMSCRPRTDVLRHFRADTCAAVCVSMAAWLSSRCRCCGVVYCIARAIAGESQPRPSWSNQHLQAPTAVAPRWVGWARAP